MEARKARGDRERVRFASPRLRIRTREDGATLVRSEADPGHCARCVGELLTHWAETVPDRVFLAERPSGSKDWKTCTYGEALDGARRIAQALLDRRLGPQRPVAILSENSVRHALLSLGAMHAGIPAVPVSPFYSLASTDFSKLKHVFRIVTPGLVFVESPGPYQRALDALGSKDFELACGRGGPAPSATPFRELLSASATDAADEAFRKTGPRTVAKILFTSGSTGLPKGVINTHGMLCSTQRAIVQCWPFLAERAPVTVDWLPWNHTFGGNHNFNMILHNGGTLYIDGGKPTPALAGETARNLREVSPTLYFNVPRGYDVLLSYLEQDPALADSFFRELDLIFCAAAPLPSHTWNRLNALSRERLGREVPLVASWGSTETAPTVTTIHFPVSESDNIGLPVPGVELKMAPCRGKLELRVKGPNVTPGYWRQPDATREAFDDEGFYRTGDAGKWIDEGSPEKGIRFDGRIAEDFKLSTGTWVAAGAVRLKLVDMLEPLAQDAVVTGQGRDYVGALLFASPSGCEAVAPVASGAEPALAEHLRTPEIRAFVRERLKKMKQEAKGSSMFARRVLLMDEPPSPDFNEITDKGYINQRAVLERRHELVRLLYADPPDARVIVVEDDKKRGNP